MNYNVDYEICTIIFLVLLLIISRVRKRLVDFQSKMYQIFMDVCFMNICLDVITCYTDSYYKAVPIWLNYGLNIIFLMVQCMIPMMVMLYIYMKVQQIREGKRCFLILAAFPAVTAALLVASSPVTHLFSILMQRDIIMEYCIAGCMLMRACMQSVRLFMRFGHIR